jgi:hypothetical protein
MCTISVLCDKARAAAQDAANAGGDALDILQAMLDTAKGEGEDIKADVIGTFQKHAETLVEHRVTA